MGACVALLATLRIRRRGRFVRDVEAGRVPGLRIDGATQGTSPRRLVRVAAEDLARVYRRSRAEDEVAFTLDA